jgi:GT2 family glycosyltransferase
VERAATPYVAFCDDDTWWDPGDLASAADVFDANPRLALATARVVVEPEGVEDPTCGLMAASPLPRDEGQPGPVLLGFLAGASIVRREAFREVGGFDPCVNLGGEEEWLAVELASRGWWLCYLPGLTVHHHPSPLRDTAGRRSQGVRNALWFLWLRRPAPVAVVRTWQVLRSSPMDRYTLRGLAAALAGFPRLVSRRRVVPPHVERGLRLLDPR